MTGFSEINAEMSRLSREIEVLSGQLEDARTEYEQRKHVYEQTFSGFILTRKMENSDSTQTDLEAYATMQSCQAKLNMILAQGTYRKLRSQLSALNGRLETVKESGWNLRAELKRLDCQGS